MSGVISPTNLSLFPSSTNSGSRNPGSRSTPLPRWNAPFINLDENIDYTMVSPLMPGPAEPNTATLIDDGESIGFSMLLLLFCYPFGMTHAAELEPSRRKSFLLLPMVTFLCHSVPLLLS